MKYLNITLLLLFFGLTMGAQSALKGVLQKGFEGLENDANYVQAAKKWNFPNPSVFNPDDCNKSGIIDLCFLVDATSSMDDQIGFLKTEIQNTIEAVQGFNHVRFRTSAVFYRDLEEEYKLKSVPFTNDLSKTIQFISDQNSAGGGDYPEAFADGFAEAVNLSWNENADAKLLFIFCDAPPHDDSKSVDLFQNTLKNAASKGITIFPIIGTAADFDTEVIMKTLASQSNGALISIQQEEALENSKADFLVNLLQNLMVEYTDLKDCDAVAETTSKGLVFGHISEAISKEPLIGANVVVIQNGIYVTGTATDLEGNYSLNITPGTYDIEFSFMGCQPTVKKNIVLNGKDKLELNAPLNAGVELATVIVSEKKTFIIEERITCGGITSSRGCCISCKPAKKKVFKPKKETDITEKNNTLLFPNPASSTVSVSASEAFGSLKILSADGKLVFHQNNINQNKLEVQVGDWTAGMYLVYYFFEGRMEIEKLVVSKL